MSKLRTLATRISSRPGQAALAVALILNASAAFAEGNRDEGRRLVDRALTEQARIYDEPQDDTVLTAEERTMLRTLASDLRDDCRARQERLDFVSAAAIDLISTAGMVSRRRADADASLRMVLASTSDGGLTGEALGSVIRDLGLPIRLGNPADRHPMKFEII